MIHYLPGYAESTFNSLQLNFPYLLLEFPKGELEESINALRAIGCSRVFNVTIPHKVDILRFMNYSRLESEKATAVNTVHNVDGILKGYNILIPLGL